MAVMLKLKNARYLADIDVTHLDIGKSRPF